MVFVAAPSRTLGSPNASARPKLVHSIVTSRDGTDGEFKVRGLAVHEDDPKVNARVAEAIAEELGWHADVGKFHLFRVDVDDVTFIHWNDTNNDQYLSRWPEGREQVRRGTSATSIGPPEPHREFLDPSPRRED